MTRNRSAVVLAFLLLAGLAAGCTSTSVGDPRPGDTAEGSTSDKPDTTSQAPPTRPREIPLDNVDPCTLLPQDDYADFDFDKPGEPSTDDQGAADCTWLGDTGYMNVTLVTYEGIEAQEGRLGQREPADPIEGFPTISGSIPGDEENACFVNVDVADGQNLKVQGGVYGNPEGIPSICEYTHQFASSLMSTLVRQ